MLKVERPKAQYVCSTCGKAHDSLDKLRNHQKNCPGLMKAARIPPDTGRLMPRTESAA